jgi:hypothetical protein
VKACAAEAPAMKAALPAIAVPSSCRLVIIARLRLNRAATPREP